MNLQKATEHIVEQYYLEKWWRKTPSQRDYARDIIEYLASTKPKDFKILELGCGIAQNLIALNRLGFEDVAGIERDFRLFSAARTMCELTGSSVKLVCGDAECVSFYGEWDVVMPLNWTYREGVDLPALLWNTFDCIAPCGELIIDIIDTSHPADQSPEYAQRFSREDMEYMVAGMYEIKKTSEYLPRIVYHLEKIS